MNKVAVITGASKGIGAATSVAFAKAGYDVVFNYQTDDKAAEKVVEQVRSAGRSAFAVKADISTETGVKILFNATTKLYPKIDVLVNNVGKANEPVYGKYTYQDIVESLSVNFISAVLCTQNLAQL